MATPEEQKSLAPFGDTLPRSKRRLTGAPPNDPEVIMMRLWEKENVRRTFINGGRVPLENILTTMDEKGRFVLGQISERDRQVVAATIQWLAASCGRGFLYEFFRRNDQAYREYLNRIEELKQNPAA